MTEASKIFVARWWIQYNQPSGRKKSARTSNSLTLSYSVRAREAQCERQSIVIPILALLRLLGQAKEWTKNERVASLWFTF